MNTSEHHLYSVFLSTNFSPIRCLGAKLSKFGLLEGIWWLGWFHERVRRAFHLFHLWHLVGHRRLEALNFRSQKGLTLSIWVHQEVLAKAKMDEKRMDNYWGDIDTTHQKSPACNWTESWSSLIHLASHNVLIEPNHHAKQRSTLFVPSLRQKYRWNTESMFDCKELQNCHYFTGVDNSFELGKSQKKASVASLMKTRLSGIHRFDAFSLDSSSANSGHNDFVQLGRRTKGEFFFPFSHISSDFFLLLGCVSTFLLLWFWCMPNVCLCTKIFINLAICWSIWSSCPAVILPSSMRRKVHTSCMPLSDTDSVSRDSSLAPFRQFWPNECTKWQE